MPTNSVYPSNDHRHWLNNDYKTVHCEIYRLQKVPPPNKVSYGLTDLINVCNLVRPWQLSIHISVHCSGVTRITATSNAPDLKRYETEDDNPYQAISDLTEDIIMLENLEYDG